MPNQRLTLAEAVAILLTAGTANTIAAHFGVSHQTVRLYKNLRTEMAKAANLRLLDEGLEIVPLDAHSGHKFTESDISVIQRIPGTSKEVAKHFGCSASMIRMIRTGKAYV